MRNLQKCPVMWKLTKTGTSCKYPDKVKCGRIYGTEFCRYRITEIGLKSCIKEISEWRKWREYGRT